MHWIVVLVLIALVQAEQIHLGLIGSNRFFGPPFKLYNMGSAFVVGINKINSNGSVLQNYTLDYIVEDSNCDSKNALDPIVRMVKDYNVGAIFGPMCAFEIEIGGLLTSKWNIIHIDYSTASPLLSNSKIYGTYSRAIELYGEMGNALIRFFKEMKWEDICIYRDDSETHDLYI